MSSGWRSALGGAVAILLLLCGLVLRAHKPAASSQWKEFSIGPASGKSVSINPGLVRSEGITLKVALAVAYQIPAVRVIGPPWLAETRYAIHAVVAPEAPDVFRPLFQQELKKRLRLETHLEVRPFDVFVLTATGSPRLDRAKGEEPGAWIHESDAELRGASMERLAAALQSILGKPVIDETGITGSYNLEFGWGEDRVTSVTSEIHDEFGLQLSPGKRDLEALIVDSIQPDRSLTLLAQIGHLTDGAPPGLRRRISSLLAVH